MLQQVKCWFTVVMFVIMPVAASHAQMPVTDAANLSENILQAARALESNLNEAEMLNNQVQSLINEAMNLEDLGYSIGPEFSEKFYELYEAINKIQGLMQDYDNLESTFDELYPDFSLEFGKMDSVSLADKQRVWAELERQMMEAGHLVGAKSLENIADRQWELDGLLSASEFAVGAKQLAQISNQINATVSQNLMELQSQTASFNQAQMSYLMRKSGEEALMRKRLESVTESYSESSEEPVKVGKW